MDAATINDRIYAGRAKAALRIGYTFEVHRPYGAGNPLGTVATVLSAAFNATDNIYAKASKYGSPTWFADLDGRLVQPGDYLVRTDKPSEIYFIAAMQSLLPIVAVDCERTIKVTAGSTGTAVGAVGYSGICDNDGERETLLGDGTGGWPCSIIFGKSNQATNTGLPSGASKQYGWQILLPSSVPVVLKSGMRLIDDLGVRYDIGGAELSDMGWRLQAMEDHA